MVTIEKKSSFPSLPITNRATALVLGGDPKGNTFLYCSTNSVVVRNIKNPSDSYNYYDHQKTPTCAKYSPTGFYICSGDISGKVRIWDTTQDEHILKCEYQPISGKIRDIAWDADSKRIAVCGEGKEKFAHPFLWDSGSSVGDMSKIAKSANSVDFKPTRPYRCAVASEDFRTYFFEGPPFKKYTEFTVAFYTREGKRFSNCVRFSSDGKYYATGNSDGNIYLCDGKSGEFIGIFGEPNKSHEGGVYCLCFSPDGKELLSASGDKTCKIWNVESREMLVKFVLGKEINDQQLSCLWQGDHLLSVSLSGEIKYLDRNNPESPLRVLTGHNKSITQMAVKPGNAIFTGSFDGVIVKWNPETSDGERFTGQGHGTLVSAMVYNPAANQLVTAGLDNQVRFACADQGRYSDQVVGVNSEPFSMVISADGYIVVACQQELVLIKDGRKLSSVSWERNHKVLLAIHGTKIIASSRTKEQFSVEGAALAVFEIENEKLVDTGNIHPVPEIVSALAFTPDGTRLLVAAQKKLLTYEMVDDFSKEPKTMNLANNVVQALWFPNNRFVILSLINCSLSVYDVDDQKKLKETERAHPKSVIKSIAWLGDNTLVSAANDCTVSQWTVAY